MLALDNLVFLPLSGLLPGRCPRAADIRPGPAATSLARTRAVLHLPDLRRTRGESRRRRLKRGGQEGLNFPSLGLRLTSLGTVCVTQRKHGVMRHNIVPSRVQHFEDTELRMKRIVAVILAIALGVNGLVMLFAGARWYAAVPGVTSTGPYNPHFVKDIGVGYLVVAGALFWRAARPAASQGAVVAAAAFLVFHAAIHLIHAAHTAGAFGAVFVRDFPGVYLPALAAAWVAWPTPRLLQGDPT